MGTALLNLAIVVIVVGVVFWLLWWLIDYIGLPEPFNKVAKVILALAAVVFLLSKLLPLLNVSV